MFRKPSDFVDSLRSFSTPLPPLSSTEGFFNLKILTMKDIFNIILFMKKYITLKNLGWLLTAVVSFMLGMAGVSKILGTQEMVNNFTYFKLLPYLTWVGVAEVVSVILLVIPRTSFWGALLIGSIMSAASIMHLTSLGGQGLLTPVLIGVLSWVSHFLRKGCMTKSCQCAK